MSKIFNFGIVDIKDARFTPSWRTWVGLIKRVVLLKGKYKGVHICRDWIYFSKFQEWYLKQVIIPGWLLDKDLFSNGKHDHYGPDVCVYLPKEINLAITRHRGWEIDKGAYIPVLHSGGKIIRGPRFLNSSDARSWYIKAKKELLELLINYYKPFLSNEIIQALRNYTFD